MTKTEFSRSLQSVALACICFVRFALFTSVHVPLLCSVFSRFFFCVPASYSNERTTILPVTIQPYLNDKQTRIAKQTTQTVKFRFICCCISCRSLFINRWRTARSGAKFLEHAFSLTLKKNSY